MKMLSFHRLLACLRYPMLRPLFSIPTHLTDRERVALFALARRSARTALRGANVIEIGSYLGASTSFIAAGLGSDGRVFCIDTWGNDGMEEGQRDTYGEFLGNTAKYQDRIVALRGWSYDDTIIDSIRSMVVRIDLLFIDGDHSYEGVLTDWRLYFPFLMAGSIVVMHDIGWAKGVQRVVEEEIRPRVRRESRLPNLWWAELKC